MAWIAERENRYPGLTVQYDHCLVVHTTHSAGGVPPDDMFCAAIVERLFA